MQKQRVARAAVGGLFLVYVAVGLLVLPDYGVSWDEPAQRAIGSHAFDYAFGGDPTLLGFGDRTYGPVFELALIGLERLLGLTDDARAIYRLRHTAVFLVFCAGAIAFYHLARCRFRRRGLALLGCAFLVLHPRLFAHAFFNSKDIPFLVLFVISVVTLRRFLRRRTLESALLHALTSALLIDLRVPGAVIYVLTAGFMLLDTAVRRGPARGWARTGALLAVHTVALAGLVTAFWPYLWPNPAAHFLEAFARMSHYPMQATVFYLGEFIRPADVPWHYAPVWMAVTTPLVVLILLVVGTGAVVAELVRRPLETLRRRRDDLLFLAWFLTPLGAVIGLGSALYDGWRQLYFVYPAAVLLALRALRDLGLAARRLRRPRLRRAVLAALALGVAGSLVWIASILVRYHPHQQVYFNRLAGRDLAAVKSRFDLDYWGLSYRQALEYVVAHDRAPRIRVYVNNLPGVFNVIWLAEADRQRLLPAFTPEQADYFISNYRHHRGEYPYRDEVFSVRIDGARIMVVYRMKAEAPHE
ncbi:MAG: hypothetical protein JXQ29_06995 [Planctomycetes bacterium]|nr:hypothetical protein [Planctomycetota bacterium]